MTAEVCLRKLKINDSSKESEQKLKLAGQQLKGGISRRAAKRLN